MRYKRIFFFCYLLFTALTTAVFAQNTAYDVKINWLGIEKKSFNEFFSVSFINCENADFIFNKHNLPIIVKTYALYGNFNNANAVLTDEKFEELSLAEENSIEKNSNLIFEQIVIQTNSFIEAKKNFIKLEFIPLRKNKNSGKYEKLISAKITLQNFSNSKNKANKAIQYYAQNSILKTGEWFKLAVWEDAIYKIDYNLLKFMGVDVDNIDPRNIRLYGNGTGMLSEQNNEIKLDDLIENKILVFGESDGKFNKDDYILFFGKGPHNWQTNNSLSYFHKKNIYSDSSYYFITCNIGAGKRMVYSNNNNLVANNSSSNYDFLYFYEKDLENLVKSGKEWFGEKFENQTTYSFPLNVPNALLNANTILKASVAGRSTPASSFAITCQGNQLTLTPPQIGLQYWMDPASETSGKISFPTSSTSDFSVSVVFNKNPNFSSATGWLNYFEIITRANIDASVKNFSFRDIESVGVGKITQFNITNFNSSNQFLIDITKPFDASLMQLNGNYFISETNSLKEFYIFTNDKNSINRPRFVERVANQDLHGLSEADMIIITPISFYSEAERLAQLHQKYDTYKVHVVTPEQIYNEFSSGAQDITAIKYFIKMFYDRAGNSTNYPKHLLLFGDASYDYKSKQHNTNFIPSYQSENATSYIDSYVSDDYFGLLDDTESNELAAGVDIAIGRLPVKNIQEAKVVVDKLYSYVERKNTASTTDKKLSAGDWKNIVCFVADDQDGGLHLRDADKLAVYVDTNFKDLNIDKIYFDSYKQETSSGGQRYPDVKTAINNRVNKGALIINYTGHGGETGWAHERVLEVGDINSWNNEEKLPLFITDTCEFSRFDDPIRTSAGEEVLLKAKGGGIGLLTTTRLVFSSPNFILNQNFYKTVFQNENNNINTIGEVFRRTKNLSANNFSNNHRNFSLLGDPAIKLHYPKNKIHTTSINGLTIQSITDTLKALSKVTVTGIITNENGIKLNDFNGIIYPTVLDKKTELSTISNDSDSPKIKYNLQHNAVYRGKVSVINGSFSFTFIVPKDISYNFGKGRISYFAEGFNEDANGYNENFIIGGVNNNATIDEVGPEIKLFMNDEKFVSGSITNDEPVLLAFLNDENGINTIGAGIGHDIVAVLDNNTEKSIVLNDFYQADLNTYQSGKVIYPFSKLEEGTHSLNFKIWDVYNNSSKSEIDFIVAKSANLALSNVLNYPNPFTTKTKFLFEHNQPFAELDVTIQIYTVSGKLIKTINQTIFTPGFRSDEIEWDGKDDFGDNIGRGVYIYKIKVNSIDGKSAEQFEKLVLLN